MKILFTSSFRISPNSGGVQRATEVLAEEFIRQGYKVYYLAFTSGQQETIKGVSQYYLPDGNDYHSKKNIEYVRQLMVENSINVIINQIGFDVPAIKFLRTVTQTVTIYTVHHNCVKCLNEQYQNIYAKTLLKKRYGFILNNSLGWYFLKKVHKYRFGKMIKEVFLRTDRLVLLANSYKKEIKWLEKSIPENAIDSIYNPNPFGIHKVNFEQKENRIVFVGRLSKIQKRVERVLEIWKSIHPDFEEWYLDILGDGPEMESMKKFVGEKELPRVNFYGFVDPKPFLKKSKILMMTSDFEGLPMVLLEAQSFGVVPISFNCFSSIQEIILPKKTGIVINDFDMSMYKKRLAELMRNQESLAELGKMGITHSKSFAPEKIVQEWLIRMKQDGLE